MASIASFDVSGGALTLANVTLSEGKAPDGEDGGALRVRNGARVSIENSTFRDNLATNGGAVALAGGGTSLAVISSSFVSNRADTECRRDMG